MDKMLYLIRGLPGSGKTTFAKSLQAANYEADMYFTSFSGVYVFDASKIKEAHEWCQRAVEADMQSGINAISVSNTFSCRWEMEAYYKLAEKYGYAVTEITMTGPLRNNVHGVPLEKIIKMTERWER